MPNPNIVNPSPSGDTIGQWSLKYNAAIDEIIQAAALSGSNLVLTKYNAGTLSVNLAPLIASGGPPPYVFNEVTDSAPPFTCPDVYHNVVGTYTPSNPLSVALPPNPAEEPRIVTVVDVLGTAATNPVTITGPGGPFTLNQNNHAITFVFDTVQGVWRMVSNYNPLTVPPPVTPYSVAFSSVLSPVFNVPVPGTEAERIVTMDSAMFSGSITINLPTTGVNDGYRLTIKRVNRPVSGNPVTIVAGASNTIDGTLSSISLDANEFDSISLIKRQGAALGAYDWLRDDNFTLNAAGAPATTTQAFRHTSGSTYTVTPTLPFVQKVFVVIDVANPVTVTLPVSPTPEMQVVIKAGHLQAASSNQITIVAPSIEGSPFPVAINTDLGSLTFTWINVGSYSTWIIV